MSKNYTNKNEEKEEEKEKEFPHGDDEEIQWSQVGVKNPKITDEKRKLHLVKLFADGVSKGQLRFTIYLLTLLREFGVDVKSMKKEQKKPFLLEALTFNSGALFYESNRWPRHWPVDCCPEEEDILAMVKMLVEAGAKVNVEGVEGTPLSRACQFGYLKVVRYLLPLVSKENLSQTEKHLSD